MNSLLGKWKLIDKENFSDFDTIREFHPPEIR